MGKLHNLGSFYSLEEAVKARQAGEELFFEQFLEGKDREKD